MPTPQKLRPHTPSSFPHNPIPFDPNWWFWILNQKLIKLFNFSGDSSWLANCVNNRNSLNITHPIQNRKCKNSTGSRTNIRKLVQKPLSKILSKSYKGSTCWQGVPTTATEGPGGQTGGSDPSSRPWPTSSCSEWCI